MRPQITGATTKVLLHTRFVPTLSPVVPIPWGPKEHGHSAQDVTAINLLLSCGSLAHFSNILQRLPTPGIETPGKKKTW